MRQAKRHAFSSDDREQTEGLRRRSVLKGASLAVISAAIGAAIPFGRFMPQGYIPVALAQDAKLDFPGKSSELMVIGDRPLVAETPAHLLDDDVTPIEVHYIRNNGEIPEPPADPDAWELGIDGEVGTPLNLTLGELKDRFENVTLQLVLECGGNGRTQFVPAARGNPWTTGGVGCARWTGVRLKDVLEAAGPTPAAVYTAHYGADPHLSGDPERQALSRGVRLEKALEPHTLIAFAMNDEPLPAVHGAPVRLIVPGWSGSASQKWLTRIQLRDVEHDGQGMKGTSYRVPAVPIVPGTDHDGTGFRILESMPVKSLITSPADGTRLPAGTRELDLRGHAWAGDLTVQDVLVSIDFGQTWQPADLSDPVNRYAWQRWSTSVMLPSEGYYEIWARAVDSEGKSQPFAAPNWNPGGYGGNAYHRIAILVEA
jgi:DMSO/TMAO reductase YedYZ molybdopterin-dependent catalytic subunit